MRRLLIVLLVVLVLPRVWAQGVVIHNSMDPSLDATAPTVTISVPTSSATYDNGTTATVTVSGTSADGSGIAICQWTNSLGGSGNATTAGDGSWSVANLPVTVGANVVTVTCLDPGNNTGTAVVTITRSAASSTQSQYVTCTSPTDVTPIALTAGAISSFISSAVDGDVGCLASGTASIGNVAMSNSKGVTLAGREAVLGASGTTNITNTGVWGMTGTLSGTNTHRYRITGIRFTGGGTNQIWFYGSGSPTLQYFRVDHNTWSGLPNKTTVMFWGDNSSCNAIYGLVDHNTITGSNSQDIGQGFTSGFCTPGTGHRGTANNIIFEDNIITITTTSDPGEGCVDWQGSYSVVWRHNTTTNCLVTSHGVTHGWGPVTWELYANTFIATSGMDSGFQDGSRFFHHQGSGEIIAFDNIFNPFSGSGDTGMLSIMHYGAALTRGGGTAKCDGTVGVDGNRSPTGTYYGYPCYRQPGRDTAGTLHPLYSWLNRRGDTGTLINWTCENHPSDPNPPLTCTNHIVANRDYYNAVSASAQTSPTSPFTGTTGMGYGTLANRPTTCSPTTQALDSGNGGVGYWATDQGEWDSTHAGNDGQLYRCSATNTWTLEYIPYPYPAAWP